MIQPAFFNKLTQFTYAYFHLYLYSDENELERCLHFQEGGCVQRQLRKAGVDISLAEIIYHESVETKRRISYNYFVSLGSGSRKADICHYTFTVSNYSIRKPFSIEIEVDQSSFSILRQKFIAEHEVEEGVQPGQSIILREERQLDDEVILWNLLFKYFMNYPLYISINGIYMFCDPDLLKRLHLVGQANPPKENAIHFPLASEYRLTVSREGTFTLTLFLHLITLTLLKLLS